MAVMSVTAKVRADGALEIPANAREKLGLNPGDEVDVELRSRDTEDDDPLLQLIGIAKNGPADLAENHDKYLYGKDAP